MWEIIYVYIYMYIYTMINKQLNFTKMDTEVYLQLPQAPATLKSWPPMPFIAALMKLLS